MNDGCGVFYEEQASCYGTVVVGQSSWLIDGLHAVDGRAALQEVDDDYGSGVSVSTGVDC